MIITSGNTFHLEGDTRWKMVRNPSLKETDILAKVAISLGSVLREIAVIGC